METSKQILSELQEAAPFLGKSGLSRLPYTAPAGFFEEFSEALMNRIRLEMNALDVHLESDPFDTILDAGAEIDQLSPLLASLQKKNSYQVPAGFFEEWKVKSPAIETAPAKLISMPAFEMNQVNMDAATSAPSTGTRVKMGGFLSKKLIRYAAAACLMAVLGTAAYQFASRAGSIDPMGALSSVSDQDMANYLDTDDIHWTPGLSTQTASADFSDSDIHDLLNSVPDSELEQYLPVLPEPKRTVN